MEESMTQEITWFRTFAIRTDPAFAVSLVNGQLSADSDIGESLNSDASLYGTTSDHLASAEFIKDSKQDT